MQKNMLLLFTSICLAGAPLVADPTKGPKLMNKTGATPKIAVVDVRRMLPQDPQLLKDGSSISHEWKDLYGNLQKTLDPINKELTDLQSQYQTKIKELEALQKSGVSSREALQKKFNDEAAPLEYRLQAQSQQAQNFMYSELNKIQSIIGPKIQKATDAIVKEQGWDFAVNKEVVISSLSSGSRFNITDDVLVALNAEYAKTKVKAAEPKKA